jgi:hypothetical protein
MDRAGAVHGRVRAASDDVIAARADAESISRRSGGIRLGFFLWLGVTLSMASVTGFGAYIGALRAGWSTPAALTAACLIAVVCKVAMLAARPC